jgi:hypothetical protein
MNDKKPWRPPVVVEERVRFKARVTPLADEDIVAWETDVAALYAALERRWQASGHTDFDALRGMLVFFQAQLPPLLFKALFECITAKVRPRRGQSIKRTEQRLLMMDVVRRCRELRAQNPGLTLEQAADLVIAERGENAPDKEKLLNALWRKKRP